MERILVIGNAGSGKSTFSKALAEKTGLPLVHLDKLWWRGNWEQTTREEFDLLLQEALEQPRWIIDGNFSRTLPHRLQYCDRVFFFDLPPWVCLWGATRRIFQHYGHTRPDMGGNCPERFDKQKLSLYRGILTYNRKHRKKYYQLLEESGVALTVFRSRKEADRFLENIR
ncbi:MAG: topology modulation protein [Oscillospiraceae bacterium]|nr:topology modulation protein [Oscillospiraceae bacterium]